MSKEKQLQIEYLPPKELKDYHRQLRAPKKQIKKTKRMVESFGLITPIIIDNDNTIVVGWHLAEAARQLNIDTVPIVRISHLDEVQIRVLRIAYDRIAEEAEWDKKALAVEKTSRKARLIEIDPLYCDVTIRRWQELTGKDAIHNETGKTFNETQDIGGTDHE